MSSLGRFRRDAPGQRTRPGREVRVTINRRGYGTVHLSWRNEKKVLRAHRLVALAFLGPPRGLEVNHIDGNPSNNRAANLEYVTRQGNADHATATGLLRPARGEAHGHAVLTEAAVREVRDLRALGLGYVKIARVMEVSKGAIRGVVGGKNWGHIA